MNSRNDQARSNTSRHDPSKSGHLMNRSKPQQWVRKVFVDGEPPASPGGGGIERFPGSRKLPLSWKERTKHFTFTWFTLTMSTAGVAHVLKQVPLRFTGLYAIGCLFMILNLCFFTANCIMMGLRFYWYPDTFKAAFMHPTESLFIPAFVLSIAQILINITEYGLEPGKTGDWLLTTMTVFYWLYVVLALLFSAGIYLVMWSTQTFTLAAMTPIWIFPAYPLLLVGPFAGALSQALLADPAVASPSHSRLHIIVGGVICQGLGFLLSCMIYAAFLYRLMTQKLPTESTRPGMFVSVGPSGFTVSALIQMGNHFPTVVPPAFMGNGALAGQVSKIIAYWAGLWLWGLAIWFFLVSTLAHWSCVGGNRLTFAMTWYAFVFPNTSLVTSTFNVARALGDNFPIQIVGCVCTVVLICVWSFIIGMNLRAIVLKQVLWPQSGEDSDGHIYRADGQRRRTKEDGVAGGNVGGWHSHIAFDGGDGGGGGDGGDDGDAALDAERLQRYDTAGNRGLYRHDMTRDAANDSRLEREGGTRGDVDEPSGGRPRVSDASREREAEMRDRDRAKGEEARRMERERAVAGEGGR